MVSYKKWCKCLIIGGLAVLYAGCGTAAKQDKAAASTTATVMKTEESSEAYSNAGDSNLWHTLKPVFDTEKPQTLNPEPGMWQ
jgi:hypothetical protein